MTSRRPSRSTGRSTQRRPRRPATPRPAMSPAALEAQARRPHRTASSPSAWSFRAPRRRAALPRRSATRRAPPGSSRSADLWSPSSPLRRRPWCPRSLRETPAAARRSSTRNRRRRKRPRRTRPRAPSSRHNASPARCRRSFPARAPPTPRVRTASLRQCPGARSVRSAGTAAGRPSAAPRRRGVVGGRRAPGRSRIGGRPARRRCPPRSLRAAWPVRSRPRPRRWRQLAVDSRRRAPMPARVAGICV